MRRSNSWSLPAIADGRPISPQGSSVSAASTGRSNRATVGTASLAAPSELGSVADDEQHERPPAEVLACNLPFAQLLPKPPRLVSVASLDKHDGRLRKACL
jgi:hypothetical protein